jgi:diacylglycerol kinase family enzyme
VVAKELKLPLNPLRALDVALRRSASRIDLGELGPGGRRRFVFVAGIGFDAYVAASVRPAEKDALGVGAYVLAGLRCLRSYPFREFKVVVDGREFAATGCMAANMKRYGGGMVFCPEADMRDGLLDILIMNQRSKLRIARFFFNAWLGRAESGPWIQRLRSRNASLSGPGDIRIQADGEAAGTLPVDISILPSSFPLVMP